jgi:hypothetical protein
LNSLEKISWPNGQALLPNIRWEKMPFSSNLRHFNLVES